MALVNPYSNYYTIPAFLYALLNESLILDQQIMRTIFIILLFASTTYLTGQEHPYAAYHQEVVRSEQLIAVHKFEEALHVLDGLFKKFDFVFLREYQLATELSVHQQDHNLAIQFLQQGIQGGWTMKSIRKSKNLKQLQQDSPWENLEEAYDSLRKIYTARLNLPLRKEAYEMVKNDQKIALKVFLKIGEKSKTRYAMKAFAPYSEQTLARIKAIVSEYGYPGEKLIGNGFWTSVNLSHHNSFSREYTLKDTLYVNLRPALLEAIGRGELHPKDLAVIDDWRHAVIHDHKKSLYGFLGKIPDPSALETVNQNRKALGLRSIELRNSLLEIEKETGLNLYLPKDWQKGKITVKNM